MNKGQERVKTSFLDAQGQVILWSEVGSGRISNSTKLFSKVIVNCKYEKLKKWQHLSLWGFFRRYGMGQLTPQSMVESHRISNSSKLSHMSLLPASMKRIG